MGLATGARLGPYEVTGTLGAGGMGEVYRGRDTRLHRDVALKILPDEFAHDRDRLARFQREAQVLASLNHPNIAQIYGFEEKGDIQALVMELVEGPTLADLIATATRQTHSERSRSSDSGPAPRGLKRDDATAIALQIADALEAAHEQGITHRDLKPANIKVRPGGTVKVLDFGLAKPTAPPPSGDIADSPTVTSPAMTVQGVILGTAAYMSPEQARGKPVTHRADIWAFGCVLYEMLTGRRPFAGEDVSETLAFVLAKEPDWTLLPDDVPPEIRKLLKHCLQKDPKLRLRDIGFARLALGVSIDGAARPRLPPPDRAPRVRVALASSVLIAIGIGAGWLLAAALSRPRVESSPPVLFVETLPDGRVFPGGTLGTGTLLAVSPDGRRVAYAAEEAGAWRLFVRSLDRIEPPAAIAVGEPGAREPFFSFDGQWLGYRAGSTLKRMPIAGGPAQPIAELSLEIGKLGVHWDADGTILVSGGRAGLWRVPDSGGSLETLATPPEGRSIWYPQLLPGGRAILYTESAERADAGELRILDVATRTSKPLRRGAAGRYLPSGHLTFVANRTLWAMAFDLDRLETRGAAVPMLTDVRVDTEGGAVDAVVSDRGMLVYLPATSFQRSLVWVHPQSGEAPLDAPPHAYSNPRVSPDGSKVLVTMRDAGQDVFVWDIGRKALRQLTFDEGANNVATWIDNDRLAFSGEVGGSVQVFVQPADGSTGARQLTDGPGAYPFSSSRDGSMLFMTQFPRGGGRPDLAVTSLASQDVRRLIAPTASISETNPALSPDGRWLAYQSTRSGRFEVYVRPVADDDGGEFQVTSDGGTRPMWARDGSELYYWTSAADLVTIRGVRVRPGPPTGWGASRPVVTGRYSGFSSDTPYDVWGDRFLLMKDFVPAGPARRHEMIVVLNFLDELRRRVPGD